MAFSVSFLDELTARSDIAEVVGEYVQLKQKGMNMFGVCPFHSEKTASFSVSRDKQIYHCFGCGVGGGVINFIMRAENLEFPDAVRYLAVRAGMTVPEDDDDGGAKLRARLIEANKIAARRYHENLFTPNGKAARDYLSRRGISERTIKKFGIGWAFDSWDDIIKTAKGFDKSELIDAGLAVKNKSGGVYDRFRGRVMFPIIDVRGSVIGFGGRIIGDGEPKYLNSPETAIFNKGRNLFALNLSKKTKRDMLILAEGYMDVISLHQAGFDCAVASLGTALTDNQARLISKYKQMVVIAYDMDAAGRGAAERAIGMLDKTGVKVKILDMAGAKDPDEFIQRFGPEAFENRLTKSEGHVEYRLENLRAKYDLSSDEQRVAFLREAAELVGSLETPVERAVYAAKAADIGGVAAQVVEKEAELAAKRNSRRERVGERRKILTPANSAQPKSRSSRYANVRSAMAEEGVISLVCGDISLLDTALLRLKKEDFSAEILANAFEGLRTLRNENRPPTAAALEQILSPEGMEHIGRVLMKQTPGGMTELEDYIEIILGEAQRRSAGTDILKEWERLRGKKGK